MIPIKTLSEAVAPFDALIVDLWGVIHDGLALYPGVIDTLEYLKAEHKRVLFLSNAPRRSVKVIEALTQLGVDPSLYEEVVTSGNVTAAEATAFGQRYFYIGPERDSSLLEIDNHQKFERVVDATDADFAVVTGYDRDQSPEDEKDADLSAALKAKLPLLCANPDKVVVRQSGVRVPCAGLIAARYKEMGGEVEYYGKPYAEVYWSCFLHFEGIDKSRIAAIGDGLETDIAGAKNAGIHAIFCTGGIASALLGTTYGTPPEPEQLLEYCNYHQMIPDVAIAGFTLGRTQSKPSLKSGNPDEWIR